MTDSIRAAHARYFAAAGIMRSAGQLLVNRLQRCGLNMYDHFIAFVTYDRLFEFFVPRHGCYSVQDGCMHAGSPLDPTDSNGSLGWFVGLSTHIKWRMYR